MLAKSDVKISRREMQPYEELFSLVAPLEAAAQPLEFLVRKGDLEKIEDEANLIGKSFSGSWLGYHSRVYYENFEPPPPSAFFNREWGLMGSMHSQATRGNWRELIFDKVVDLIRIKAGDPDLTKLKEESDKSAIILEWNRSEIQSILSEYAKDDDFIESLLKEVESIRAFSKTDIVNVWRPQGTISTHDNLAVSQGIAVPPHIDVKAEVAAIRSAFRGCKDLADICRKSAPHLERKNRRDRHMKRVGTNVFLGHGRSLAWRELKDFIKDRLNLPYDEFNRVPVAGVTNISRLSEMLDAAAIAFIIMTAEDENAEGELTARMNVIHEVGLFQGRLGFTKAIVLLEESCKEFSNIQGLGQIRFPKGCISAVFEEVRLVMEREGVLKS